MACDQGGALHCVAPSGSQGFQGGLQVRGPGGGQQGAATAPPPGVKSSAARCGGRHRVAHSRMRRHQSAALQGRWERGGVFKRWGGGGVKRWGGAGMKRRGGGLMKRRGGGVMERWGGGVMEGCGAAHLAPRSSSGGRYQMVHTTPLSPSGARGSRTMRASPKSAIFTHPCAPTPPALAKWPQDYLMISNTAARPDSTWQLMLCAFCGFHLTDAGLHIRTEMQMCNDRKESPGKVGRGRRLLRALPHDQDVAGLQVAVQHPVGVHELQALQQLRHHRLHHVQRHRLPQPLPASQSAAALAFSPS